MKNFAASLKKDPSSFFFNLFLFLSFISARAGQVALVLSLVFTVADKNKRRSLRMTWPAWGWAAYLVFAVVLSGIMCAVNTDALLNPRRGFAKIFEHLLWYAAIPAVASQITSRERFFSAVKIAAAGGLALAAIVLLRNPFLAWFRYSYPNPGEVRVLQAAGFDATDDHLAERMIIVRDPSVTGGIEGADAAGRPAGAPARLLAGALERAGLGKAATSWVFNVKPRRKALGKDGTPKGLRGRTRADWDWYCWRSDGTKAGLHYLSKRELYSNVYGYRDKNDALAGNRPASFKVTLEAIGEHSDALRLLIGFIASLLLACSAWRKSSAGKRTASLLLPLALFLALVVTFKEGAILIAILFSALVPLSFAWRSWWKAALAIVAALTLLPTVLSIPKVSSFLKSSGCTLVTDEYKKGGRLMMWMDVVPAIHSAHPFGTGFKGITSAAMRSANPKVEPREHVHNVLLQVFIDFGIAGAAIWLLWMALSMGSALSVMRRGQALCAADARGNADESDDSGALFRFPFAALCALLLAGVVEYNLPDSESILMYSLAMGLAAPRLALSRRENNGAIAFLEKVFLCPRKGGGESLRGVELFNLNLVKDLLNSGYSVFFPADKSWIPVIREFTGDRAGLTLRPVASLRHPVLNCLSASLSICRYAKDEGRFRVLFVANDVNGLIPSIYLLAKSRAFEKAVVFAHKIPGRSFVNAVSAVEGHIIGVCEPVAAPFRTDKTKAAVHVDYGISGGAAFYPAETRGSETSEKVRFCLVGGLDSVWKGADTAVAAFRLLPERVKARAELHLMAFSAEKDFGDPRIICHKWKKPAEVPDFLRSMDVMLTPSRLRESDGRLMETFSQVVVQGMLTGLPVIHTTIPVFTEKFDNGGGIAADTPEEFAAAMESLAESAALREELGKAGRATALERYVWDTARFITRYIEETGE